MGVRRDERRPVTDTGPDLRLGLLDGFQLESSSFPVDLPYGAQRVVAFLALATRPLMRVYVASQLWVEHSEARAAASLRSALWRINLCGHRLVEADSRTLRLVPTIAVDVRETAKLAQGVVEGMLTAERCRLSDLTLAGPLLPGWYDEWVVTERERLHQLRLRALEVLCQQLTATGRFSQAVEAGLAAVTSEPLRESAHRALMQAYLGEGNHAQAIRQYQACRQILQRELGIEPSSLTASLVPSGLW